VQVRTLLVFASVAQLVRALPCQGKGREFESHLVLIMNTLAMDITLSILAVVIGAILGLVDAQKDS
jgi:hypothetical protein